MDLSHYNLLAELFWYPDLAYADRVKPVHEFLAANYPDAAREMDAFVDLFPFSELYEMEELFTRSFDVQSTRHQCADRAMLAETSRTAIQPSAARKLAR